MKYILALPHFLITMPKLSGLITPPAAFKRDCVEWLVANYCQSEVINGNHPRFHRHLLLSSCTNRPQYAVHSSERKGYTLSVDLRAHFKASDDNSSGRGIT